MTTINNHLHRHPNARAATLVYLQKRDEKTAQLRREIEVARKPKAKLAANIQALRALIGWK